jgi:hypothetical protein
MGSDRRQFFNQLVNVGALSGLVAMFPSDAFARMKAHATDGTANGSDGPG